MQAPVSVPHLEWSTKGRIAFGFASDLTGVLSPAEFAEMKRKNEDPAQPDGVCASHDYCDANIVMAAAFERVMGREPREFSHIDPAKVAAAYGRS